MRGHPFLRHRVPISRRHRNAGRELGTGDYVSLARLPQKLLNQHALLSLLCPGRTQPVLFLVCCFKSAVTFDSTFLFEAPPLFAWVTLRTRLCHIDDPRSFTLRTSTSTRFTLHALTSLSAFSNFSQHDNRYSTNTKFTVRRKNTYMHMHTYTACVQHVNVGLAQARPNNC